MKELYRSVETSCWAENHAPSIKALGLLTSMRLLVDVRLLARLYGGVTMDTVEIQIQKWPFC